MISDQFYLVGVASGLAGADVHSGQGPIVVQNSPYLLKSSLDYQWIAMLESANEDSSKLIENLSHLNLQLAEQVSELVREKKQFCVVGGDHTCAIGTWSGVYDGMHDQGDLGLIWIDAHMDSHTPETSLSGRIHGMPLAVLLGYGEEKLTGILHSSPKLLPQNVCLIGVRSFESGEAELLKRLNVRIYFMEEVIERGLMTVMREAVAHVSKHTAGFGISLDLDGIDPAEAPGVDVPEPNGIKVADLLPSLQEICHDPNLIATEVVEFDPKRDKQEKTEKIVAEVIQIFAKQEKSSTTKVHNAKTRC